MLDPTKLLVWGMVIHWFFDWIMQNHWMAENKSRFVPLPRKYPAPPGQGPSLLVPHPAAWVHSGIHLLGLLVVFPPLPAIIIAITHLLIDTRVPLQWWRRFYRQTTGGPVALHVAIWGDQVAHITVIAIAALTVGGKW